MPAIRRRWTTADVRALIDESRVWPRYELIADELLVTPAPGWSHQIAVGEILKLLDTYLEAEPIGIAVASPADLELRPGTITQPDVFVVPPGIASATSGGPRWTDVKSLLLAVEVVSPSSMRTDRIAKRDLYLDSGVAEYWIVDVDAGVVERWTPLQETPTVLRDRIEWQPKGAATGLVVQLPALFERIARKLRLLDAPHGG